MRTSVQRAYSFLEIKSVDRAQRVIFGIASTPEVDRGGDSMDPAGAKFTLPMPFLWQHGDPIGEVFAADVKADGIHIKARISAVAADAPPSLRDRIETAWHSISANPPLVRGLSIGWSPLKSAVIAGTKFRRISEWVWGETSAVTVPMNASALITSVKSLAQFDRAPAASGVRVVSSSPGVTGSPRITQMKISEQLTAEKANLQAKTADLETLMNDETTNGGLDADETARRDSLMTEVKGLTQRVSQLSTLEAAQMAGAVTFATVPSGPSRPRVEVKAVSLPKGTLFTRVAMALMAGRGSRADSLEYAKHFSNTPEVHAYIKGDYYRKADAGSSIVESPGWGGELVNPDTMLTEFVELLRAQTIIGKVSNFRRAQFNVPVITQTSGSTFNWVGEGAPKPVGELAFTSTTLTWAKVAGIVVMHEELVKFSRPNAEAIVREDMVEQCALFLDRQFIQVGISAGANNPASITNGVSAPNATGVTAAALRHDLNIALTVFTAAGVSTSGIVIVMTSALARGISLLTTTLGVPEFPSMTPEGGTLVGYQVIVSDSVDSGTIVLFQPREIFLADEGRVTLDASREATLDMSGSTTAAFSLWQNNCVAIRAEQFIKWQKRRSAGTVAVIDTAAYAPA